MASIPVKNGNGAIVYIDAVGAGTLNDPFQYLARYQPPAPDTITLHRLDFPTANSNRSVFTSAQPPMSGVYSSITIHNYGEAEGDYVRFSLAGGASEDDPAERIYSGISQQYEGAITNTCRAESSADNAFVIIRAHRQNL